jgi:alkylation response protein AidB-like acyl-CoA dehydrogenase
VFDPTVLPLTDDERAIADGLDRFIGNALAPAIGAFVDRHAFPTELVREFLALGFMGAAFPEADGGAGLGVRGGAMVVERLARCEPGFAAIVLCNAASMGVLARFGRPEQRARWLGPLIRGEMLSSFGVTEPHGGSDAAAARTRAEWTGREWVLNGAKVFSTNAGTPLHGLSLVLAQTDAGGGARGLSTFVVPAGTPGFAVGAARPKIGWRIAPSVELFLSDVRLPPENLVGERGDGLRQVLTALASGRILVAACGLGLAAKAIGAAAAYARGRMVFGRPVIDNQVAGFRLADLSARALAAALAIRHAADRVDAGEAARVETSAAKLLASELAVDAALAAVHLHGGYGVFHEYDVSGLIGEAKVLEIVEGTSEMQRLVIARECHGVGAHG